MIPGASDSVKQPDKEYKNVVCGEPGKIGKGQLVRIANATDLGGTADGLTVMLTSSRTHVVYGVATESASRYDNLRVQVGGFCEYINTDGNVCQDDLLVPCELPGVATAAPLARYQALGFQPEAYNAFGVALDADSTATLTKAMISCLGR